jgi:hypothetical protein
VARMNQKDSSKGFDIDIMQCREDIIRARQNAALDGIKKPKDKEKEEVRESQVTSGERINSISEADKSAQPAKIKETAEINPKNDLSTLNKTAPSLINNTQTWTDIRSNEDKPIRIAEDVGAIARKIPETEIVVVKDNAKLLKTSVAGSAIQQIKSKVQETPTHERADIYNADRQSSEADSINVTREHIDERQSEKLRYSQSNEMKFIEQVKSMRVSGEQSDNKEVPRFDLAEQIMAQQRKNSAAKRKAPVAKIVSIEKQTSENKTAKLPMQEADEEKQSYSLQQKIIARIVRQDIERFCAGKEQRGRRSFVD